MTGEQWVQSLQGLTARDARLVRRSVRTLEHDILHPAHSPWGALRGIAPSVEKYMGVWNWDSAYHAMAVRRWDPELAREQAEIIFATQTADGRLADSIYQSGRVVTECSKPPIWAWAYQMIDEMDPDDTRLARAYEVFVRYEQFWREKRRDTGEPLFHYDSDEDGPNYYPLLQPLELTRAQYAKFESGMDTSARWAKEDVNQLWAIDLNCYMVKYYRAMGTMAHRLGLEADASVWSTQEQALSEAVNQHLWDASSQCYLDAYRNTGTYSSVWTPMSFLPLYAGIASPEQASHMAAHAADESLFYPGLPCCAYRDPSYRPDVYWEGPTWINLDYMMLKGLKSYGFHALAEEFRQLLLYWCDREKRGLFEYYDSITGKGLGANHYGWTAALVIELILDW